MVRPRGRFRFLRQLVRVLDRPVPWGRRRGPPLCVRLPRKTSLRSARGGCALVWRALRATLEEMFKLALRGAQLSINGGPAPSEGRKPPKTGLPEAPPQVPVGKATLNR